MVNCQVLTGRTIPIDIGNIMLVHKTVTNTLRRNENLLLYCTTIFLQFSLAQVKTKPLYNQNVSSV